MGRHRRANVARNRLFAGAPARRKLLRRVALASVLALAGSLVAAVAPATPAAPASCANPIVCENQQAGTSQDTWDISNGDGSTIQGFADPFSVPLGGTINFKIETSASSYKVDIYRIGYYNGDGARLIASVTPNITVSRSQPSCNTNTVTGLVDCGNWGVSATWSVPSAAVSGVYFALIYSATDENQIPFVVTNPASTASIVFMTSDETWQAYNDWGGYSLYAGTATGSPWNSTHLDPGRAVQVSYNRPFATRFDTPGGQDFFFANEFPMIGWLEQNGYNVTYVSQSDVSQPGAASMLEQHKVLMTAGHSEYFDAGDRTNITAARDAGVNLAFFSGNLMWWKTRWAASQYGNEPDRTLISYKESLDGVQSDPVDPPTWTGEWRDPRFMASGDDSGQPENALTGQLWMVNCCSYAETASSAYSPLALWKNTKVASLTSGQTYTMSNETLGYEWDEDVNNAFRPPGEIDMSKTCETNVDQILLDYQEDIGSGTACNSLTLYRAASGALVFDAGTVQWAWGLNANHDGDSTPTDPVMQQATINLLAMMGVQPATLMAGMVAGVQPAYTSPPTSSITSPSSGATLASGSTVTISGTATDSGGGVVAGVEVSTDGGSTWQPVTAMSNPGKNVTWSYTWSATGNGQVTIMSRATDDDATTESPGASVSVSVNCPCGLFGANYTPSTTSANDNTALELGVKFQSSVPGWVDGVRFYKGTGNNGSHTGSLWTASGTLLATGTFTNETASGWQTLQFANPVQVDANTTYVVSYWDPDGHYAAENDLFDFALKSPPLTALQTNNVKISLGNGVYNIGGQAFPTLSYNGTNYAVDVIFDTTEPPGEPPVISTVTPYPGSSSNPASTAPAATFSKAIVPGDLSMTMTDAGRNPVSGSTTFNSTDTVATFTPTASLAADATYTVTVSGVQDHFGQTAPGYTYSFTTSQSSTPGQCPCTIWPDVQPPGSGDAADTTAVTVGIQFQAATSGDISGIRFYKEPDDTGTHVGSLWTSSGQLLATGTFSNESTVGWEQLNFSAPVAVTAGTTYDASYFTSTGHYAVTPQGLSSAVTSGQLTALANGGVYAYGSASTFPSSTFNGSNYWIDVVYGPNLTPPTATAVNPINGQTSVPTDSAVTFSFNEPVQSGTISFTLTAPGAASVPGTLSYNSANDTATFVPSGGLTGGTGPLAANTTYTATVSGAKSVATGTPMPGTDTWSFTTAQSGSSAGQCPCSIWPDSAEPVHPSSGDTSSVNVGVQFTASENGTITGIRFYKGAGNTGTHVGSLWNANGSLLGQVTFTSESAAGWQQANFATPIAVTAGQTYTASYLAPGGDYAADAGGLAAAVTSGPLTALASGGVYIYGSSSADPVFSFNSANYWVDVVFAPPQLTASPVNPVNGQTSVPTDSGVSFSFSQPVQPSTVSFTLTGPGGASIPGSVSFNSADTTATFVPSAWLASDTAYTATVSGAQSASGTALSGTDTWGFTSAQPTPPAGQCPCSIWPDSSQPVQASSTDTASVNLGVQFTASENGWITGIRFYKGPENTGTHVGSLWNAAGTLLGQVTFSGESSAGWEQANFATPIPVTAGATYTASYLAPSGGYAADAGALAAAVTSGPLTAVANGGVYINGSSSADPVDTFNAANYWVDVVFTATQP